MTSDRVMFVVEYEDGKTAEFSIDRWTLSLGDYAARIIARERQEKGDLPPGAIRNGQTDLTRGGVVSCSGAHLLLKVYGHPSISQRHRLAICAA
jgi:hypothetical protein